MDPTKPEALNPYSPPAAALDPGTPAVATADYRPLRGLATALTVVLGAYAVFCVAVIANDASLITQMSRILAHQHFLKTDVIEAVARDRLLRLLLVGLKLTAAVLFCLIMPRANRNARGFGRMPMTITPGMAAGYFFVPILSLWMPLMAMKEIWRASEPSPDPRIDPRSLPVPDLLWIWWVAFVIQSIAAVVLARVGGPDGGLGASGALEKSWADIVAVALAIASALLAVAVVRALARRQDDCQAAIAPRPASG